jgi:hypothetical protein
MSVAVLGCKAVADLRNPIKGTPCLPSYAEDGEMKKKKRRLSVVPYILAPIRC